MGAGVGSKRRVRPSQVETASESSADGGLSIVLEAQWVCTLFGFNGEADDDEDDRPFWRTAVHESGHALVALVHGIDFERIVICAGDSEAAACRGEVAFNDVATLPRPAFEMRIACDVGGAVAEELVFGQEEPFGVWTDLRVALARAHVTSIDGHVDRETAGVRRVDEQVEHVRRMLRRRRRALERLAEGILRTKDVTRGHAVRVVREAGTRVRVRPKFSPTLPRQELDRCDQARLGIAERTEGLPRRS